MSEARAQLALRQAELVAALQGGPLLEEFNSRHLRLASEMLLRRRMREAASAWPRLAMAMGDRWESEFIDYAKSHARPGKDAAEDGYRFAIELKRRKKMPAVGLEEFAVARARRSGIAVTRMRESFGFVVAVLLPNGKVWSLRVGRCGLAG